MKKDELANILFSYVRGQIGLEAIHDWLAANVWHLSGEAQELADEIGAALAYIDDGYSDEFHFQLLGLEILEDLSMIDRTDHTYYGNPSLVVTDAMNTNVMHKVEHPSFSVLSLETIPAGAS